MSQWGWETWDAIRRADNRRTQAFGAAVDAMCAEADLGAGLSVYNQMMMVATKRWQDECTNAIALSEDEPF